LIRVYSTHLDYGRIFSPSFPSPLSSRICPVRRALRSNKPLPFPPSPPSLDCFVETCCLALSGSSVQSFIVQSFCSLVVFFKFSWCACFVCFMFLCSYCKLNTVLLCCHVRRNKDTHEYALSPSSLPSFPLEVGLGPIAARAI